MGKNKNKNTDSILRTNILRPGLNISTHSLDSGGYLNDNEQQGNGTKTKKILIWLFILSLTFSTLISISKIMYTINGYTLPYIISHGFTVDKTTLLKDSIDLKISIIKSLYNTETDSRLAPELNAKRAVSKKEFQNNVLEFIQIWQAFDSISFPKNGTLSDYKDFTTIYVLSHMDFVLKAKRLIFDIGNVLADNYSIYVGVFLDDMDDEAKYDLALESSNIVLDFFDLYDEISNVPNVVDSLRVTVGRSKALVEKYDSTEKVSGKNTEMDEKELENDAKYIFEPIERVKNDEHIYRCVNNILDECIKINSFF